MCTTFVGGSAFFGRAEIFKPFFEKKSATGDHYKDPNTEIAGNKGTTTELHL